MASLSIHKYSFLQTDLKRLQRNPPTVKIPKVGDLITTHPFLGALPSNLRDLLVGSTKEEVKVRGMALYKEGGKPNGIWLIANGVVKVNENVSFGKELNQTCYLKILH